MPDCIRLEHAHVFWYLAKISFKLMINLCNAARTLKKAACLYYSGTKEEAVLSFGGGGIEVRGANEAALSARCSAG